MDDSNILVRVPNESIVEITGESIFVGSVEWLPVRYQSYQGFMMADYLVIISPYQENAVFIPFGEYVEITKMTIDRLWCYVPAVESWIKAEDISFNQAGKLYNGIQIEVIDLDEIDFSNVSSFF